MLFSLSACGAGKNTDEEKAENDTTVISQTENASEEEPTFSLDAKPVDGKEYIGDGLVYILYDDNSIEIISHSGNKAEISIPSEINDYPVSRIAASAFENCTFLEDVNIWADVIIIGESAFKGCTNLKEISIPSSVSEICDSTFEGCTNLEKANIWGDVVRIGINAFKNCVSLKKISIPSSCLLVDKSAFEGCTDMEDVNLWGGEVIGECAFKNCTSLKKISIPSEVTTIKESAFEGCKDLKEILVWGDNVTFGVNVFANCPKLEELPDGAYPDGVYGDDKSASLAADSTNQQVEEETTKSANTAGAPDVWTNLLEKHYEEVKKQFEDAGFTNIICVAHEIDYDENKVFEGSVINIAIGENGEICTFEKDEQWAKDVKIRIDYRVKPNGEKNPDSSTTMSQSSTDANPYNKIESYSVYTENEYAHIDSDVIRLGNNERVWITIKASPSNLSADDFIVDYDDTMLEIVDITSSTTGNVLEIELTIKAKKAGVSEIIICSGYEIYEETENADCYVLTVNGLDASDGRIVYVTSSGEKYHFSSSCADNGIKTTLDDALAYEYEPCGKCAK